MRVLVRARGRACVRVCYVDSWVWRRYHRAEALMAALNSSRAGTAEEMHSLAEMLEDMRCARQLLSGGGDMEEEEEEEEDVADARASEAAIHPVSRGHVSRHQRHAPRQRQGSFSQSDPARAPTDPAGAPAVLRRPVMGVSSHITRGSSLRRLDDGAGQAPWQDGVGHAQRHAHVRFGKAPHPHARRHAWRERHRNWPRRSSPFAGGMTSPAWAQADPYDVMDRALL